MQQLNLPDFEYTLRKIEDKLHIFDAIRKKYLVLTPEEWVRQHVVHFLIHHLGYPKSLIKMEAGHSQNQRLKRTDILVYRSSGELFMLVECKAPEVGIQASVFEQAFQYNMHLKAEFVFLTNGLQHYCYAIHPEAAPHLLTEFPSYKV
ncbi:type I restriction enzyme HsdR N-terminal domain-containing protein [Cytophagales bacterium LB-30]|uniref:Type I restriction enzyme HsdR N-terminal domain-containing protein n=1 Tax=Shiella aurantiaca TaxID=3058365 RepID=A0ABT8F1P6_9BACT|nr:type I restriction enzyme HsdR N-terminal domain-containing protein [Shiella aurantiaca]MDN4164377.1 type I restriction enzyme HsdR N-terminal domain-containing protein [Shiella aurantiaca]